MELLAIRSTEGKGVYLIKDKKIKNDILKQYPNCSNKIFAENEKNKALEWAGVKEISNRNQQVVEVPVNQKSSKNNKHEFVEILENFKKQGYTHVELELSNGKTYKLWINDFIYLTGREIFCDLKSSIIMGDIAIDLYINRTNLSFDDFKNKFDEAFNKLNAKNTFNYSEVLYTAIKKIKQLHSWGWNHYFCRFKQKAEINIYGDLINISHAFCDEKHKDKDNYLLPIQEIDPIDNFVVNSQHIVSIIPLKLETAITDKRHEQVVKKLIKDNILDKNGNFIK